MLQVVAALGGLLGAVTGAALGDWIGVRPAVWALDLSGLAAMTMALSPAVRAARAINQRPNSSAGPAPDSPQEYGHHRKTEAVSS